LAQQEDFFGMCEASLWGTEADKDSEQRQQFGEMLRGLVLSFKPRTTFHLHLLRNIADIQWTLERATRYRKGIFSARQKQLGQHGMSAGTELGLEYNRVSLNLMKQLEQAISIYQKAVS
jgi:hypothetical protein